MSASPSIPNQREALLTGVKEAVQTDPNSLHTFANVLCRISTNVSLGQTILDATIIVFIVHSFCGWVSFIHNYESNCRLFCLLLLCLGKYFPTPEVFVVPETIMKDHEVVPQGKNSLIDK